MKSRAFKISVAVFVLALSLSLIAVRAYVLAVELDPLTGFAAPGQGRWQNVFLVVLLAGTAVIAALCYMSGRVVAVDSIKELPVFLRGVGVVIALVLVVDAAVGAPSAVGEVGAVIGILLTLAKLAVAYSILAQSMAFTNGEKFAYHPISTAIEAVPVLYCIVILLDTFLNYVAFNSTSQHLIEQMSVIASMLFFLGTFSFCLKVSRAGDYILTVVSGCLGFMFLAISILPPYLVYFATGTLPTFLTRAAGFSPVMGCCLMVYMGLFSLLTLLSKAPAKMRVLGEQPQD